MKWPHGIGMIKTYDRRTSRPGSLTFQRFESERGEFEVEVPYNQPPELYVLNVLEAFHALPPMRWDNEKKAVICPA